MAIAPLRYILLASVTKLPVSTVWRAPRDFFACKAAKDAELLQRLEAVHANAQEGLPVFFAAVLAAVIAGVPAEEVDRVAVNYIASRVAYTVVYLASSRSRAWLGPVRTLSFAAGFFPVFGLFLSAARARGE